MGGRRINSNPKFSESLVRLSSAKYVVPSGCPVSLVVFVPITTGSTYNGTHKLVERNNSLPGALLADFAPLGGARWLLSAQIAAKGRLDP
jgi:hypothetical protein